MPDVDESGVYQIGTAEELLAFAKYVNKGNTKLNAVLTDDVDLTGKTWTPMVNFGGTFDGQKHTITFDKAPNGLFASTASTFHDDSKGKYFAPYVEISNLIIEGTIEGNQKVGAIVGSACGTKITNCINRANISTTGNYAGGLVGYADYQFRGISYAYVNFLQCGNEGDIQGNNYVGGFIGYTMGGTTLERCYNDGTISGNTRIGGLAGYMRSYAPACSLSNSYNWGGISGSASTGGLVGEMSNTVSVTNCYNAGVVEYALAGSNASGISGFYYLSDASTNVAKNTVEATKMSADDMKSAEFVTTQGDYFRKGSTYPILSWQAAGDAEEYTVTVSRNEGITFNGANIAYSNEAYQFTITINPRYQATNEFKILVNSNAIDYSETDGVYSCTVEEVNGNLTIAVQGVKATKTIVYQGTGLPVSYGYVSEIAVDDVDVKSVRTDGTTIYVTLDGDTELDADVYFTVVKAGDASTILGVSPGTSFTKSLSFGGLTQTITATMPNSGTAEWTVVVSVDGIVSHSVILPAGEGYVVNGNAAVIDGQDYTFTVEVDKKYTGDTMVVKVGDTTLTPDENGIYTVKNVKDDIEITITGVTKKPFESPLERIEIGGNVLDEEKIVLKTDDFHLGGKGETFDYRVYEEVPYYHVTVPKGTEWVEVIFKAITNILVDSREDKSNVSYGYTTDISNIDAITSPTIRGTSFEYTKNADGTQSVKIPVTGYTVSETGGKAIGPESSEELQNRPVALFSFLYEKELFAVTLPEAETYTIIPESGYTTSVVEGKDFKFTVRTTPGYVKGQEFAVTADEETLTPDENGVYTIETILDDVKIAVTGVEERDPVSVYLSISHDDQYMVGDKTGKVMALQKVDVPWFDLESYGLERYNYADNYGTPSVLHLYIYATELFYCGLDAEEAGRGYLYEQGLIDNPDKTKSLLTIDGNPGSLYLKRFWTYDENLNYYSNYVFPTYAGTTIGATADRMALKENDVISLGHFSFWEAYQDPASIFNYFQVGNGSLREVIGTEGDEVSLSVKRAAGDLFAGTSWTNAVEEEVDIYYTKLSELNSGDVTTCTKLGTTDKNGQIQFILTGNIGEPGQYLVAMAGRYGTGTGNTEKICSAPGSILLTVEEKAEDEEVNAVIELIRRIGTVTLDSGETIEIARKAYDALTESQQKEVTNYDALTAAEERYGKMTADKAVADVVVELIGNIGEVTLDKKASIEDARAKYTALTEDQKALVGNYSELISAERSLALLERNPIFEDAYQETKTYFESLDAPTVGSTDGEWRVIGLARSGADVSDEYYRNVVSYVRSEIDGETNRLDHNKSTENSRVILALTALGKDVTNVGGYDLLAGLNDMNYIGKQGINGTIWALIALDSANYEIQEGDVTREKLIEAILKAQKSDGSWTMNSDSYGLDMTGMALQALAGYYETNDVVKTAVDKALTGLSALQTQNGMFGSETSTTSESLAQIVVALTALGIDPDTDPRFIKEGGVSVLDAMLTFYKGEGRFEHGLTLGDNVMATEQCFYAMTAYNRFLEGKTSLYEMSDVEKDDSDTPIVPVETVTLSSSTLNVSVGKTAVLTATVSPAEATDHLVEWSSSDETVARVSKNGMVTGVGEGVAEIVASCGGVSASCTVTVAKQETGGTVTEPELEFGLSSDEILGYVYVSFEDYGVRKSEELDEMESQFRKPLGMIVSKTKVPYKKNDTIASVTLRLLDYMGIGAEYEGTEYRGFYLES
ncbi:MAG: Ig-like domain-containing protein, partial [Firmicutes bacterium]|nr:Ig-like domain-containing protein [Bacillota bacterium]